MNEEDGRGRGLKPTAVEDSTERGKRGEPFAVEHDLSSR
jgi:hypothetical protein